MRFASFIWKSSLRNRRRTLLTLSSIAVSMCLLSVLMAVYQALYLAAPTPGQALRLVTRHRVGLGQPLPAAYLERIERTPGVREAMRWQWFGGTYKDQRDSRNFFARFGCQPERLRIMRPEYSMPEEAWKRFVSDRTAAIVSRKVADRLGFKVGDRITIVGDIFPVNLELRIAGIYDDPQGEEALYYNDDYVNESLPVGSPLRDTTGTFQILASSAAAAPEVAQAIDAMFANSPAPTKTESEQQFALSFVSFLGNLKLFLMAICGAITFTILLVSANAISMSVRERVREVGVLKTLGFTAGGVLGIILGEAMMIAVAGGALGCVMGGVLCIGARNAGAMFLNGLSLTPAVAAVSLGAAAVLGFFSALTPAWQASRTSILEALQYAG
jgi:putative ABC transport system permease protein